MNVSDSRIPYQLFKGSVVFSPPGAFVHNEPAEQLKAAIEDVLQFPLNVSLFVMNHHESTWLEKPPPLLEPSFEPDRGYRAFGPNDIEMSGGELHISHRHPYDLNSVCNTGLHGLSGHFIQEALVFIQTGDLAVAESRQFQGRNSIAATDIENPRLSHGREHPERLSCIFKEAFPDAVLMPFKSSLPTRNDSVFPGSGYRHSISLAED